jgi:F-type H+-transporting ATPase subunit beta
MATKFTGVEGSTVPRKETIEACSNIAKGEFDHIPEQAFYNLGGIDDIMKAYDKIQKETK